MLKWLKNLFKNTYIDLDVSSIYTDNKVYLYQDIYTKINFFKCIAKGPYHYKNVRANEQTIKLLNEKLEHNLFKTKNKYKRNYTDKYLQKIYGMDILVYAPYTDNSIPNNKIRIILPNNKLYEKADQ